MGGHNGNRLFNAYLALLVFAPLPFGSNRPWAWGALEAAAWALLAIVILSYLRGRFVPGPGVRAGRSVLVALVAWVCYQALQTIPLPGPLAGLMGVSYDRLPVSLYGLPDTYSISLDRGSTVEEVLKSAAYVVLFVLTLLLVDSKERLRRLLITLALTGVVCSAFALVAMFREHAITGYRDAISGPYVNPNHFAAFLGMSIAAALGASASWRGRRRLFGLSRVGGVTEGLLDWHLHLASYAAIMVVALLFTGSRGGFAALSLGLTIVLAVMALNPSIRRNHLGRHPVLLTVMTAAGGWALWLMLGGSLTMVLDALDERLAIWIASVSILGDAGLFGFGAGAFENIYPLYNDGSVSVIVDHAHNDYLELMVDQGVLGFVLIATAVLVALRAALGGILGHNSLAHAGYALAASAGMFVLLIHGLVDFNFHIPANAVYFFVFMGVALAQAAVIPKREQARLPLDEAAPAP